jgi:hypothetical protein
MEHERERASEAIQKQAVKVLATNPVGEGLCLIGGFRYRLLDASCRRSLVRLFRKKLLPLLRERMGFDGSVSPATGPDADSPAVKTVELAVWQQHGSLGRITIPVDITRIPCEDKPIARTVDGVVYLSASDADMIESKIVALFARRYLEERDIVDVFLFQGKLAADAGGRVNRKLGTLRLARAGVSEALRKIATDRDYHVRNIEGIVRDQIDPPAAANLHAAGGAATIFDQVLELLTGRLGLLEGRV